MWDTRGAGDQRRFLLRRDRRESMPEWLERAVLEGALAALGQHFADARIVHWVVVGATLATLARRAFAPLLAHLAELRGTGRCLRRAHLLKRDAWFLLQRPLLPLALVLKRTSTPCSEGAGTCYTRA